MHGKGMISQPGTVKAKTEERRRFSLKIVPKVMWQGQDNPTGVKARRGRGVGAMPKKN